MSNEAIQFDTHKFVKNLVASGFTEQQAESLANEQINLINSNLATKENIEQLRLETKADIEQLRLETKAGIEQLRLATKADIEAVKAGIEQLRLETKASIEQLRLETQKDIEKSKVELIKWMIAQGAVVVSLIAFIVKF